MIDPLIQVACICPKYHKMTNFEYFTFLLMDKTALNPPFFNNFGKVQGNYHPDSYFFPRFPIEESNSRLIFSQTSIHDSLPFESHKRW